MILGSKSTLFFTILQQFCNIFVHKIIYHFFHICIIVNPAFLKSSQNPG